VVESERTILLSYKYWVLGRKCKGEGGLEGIFLEFVGGMVYWLVLSVLEMLVGSETHKVYIEDTRSTKPSYDPLSGFWSAHILRWEMSNVKFSSVTERE
jgi:hypothetical protein